jgi:arylsulfatase
MLTDGSWKYIWYEQDGKELLFNIKNDPNELENLSTHEHSMKITLKDQLLQILIGRDDEVVKNGDLRPSNVNRFQTTTEKEKNILMKFY